MFNCLTALHGTDWVLLSKVVQVFKPFFLYYCIYILDTYFPLQMTAQYYDQPGERMDLIPTVSYGLGIPFCIIATYVVERFGLKVGLHIGGFLTGIGELHH